MFYIKLAFNNLRKSKEVVAPFLLASNVLFLLNCIVVILIFSPISKTMSSGNILLGLAIVVLTLFSVIMEAYSYNFLLKQRSKEFGLYNILGMNKKQVGLVSTIELSFLFIVTILLGSLFSIIFSHFFYLVFANLTHYNDLKLTFNPLAFLINALIFALIFVLLGILGIYKIRKTSPLLLFQDQEQGEKEPRGNILLALLALMSLGMGYYLSISSTKIAAMAIISRFFIAVILVIIGTYLFYISFMSWYLKKKRQNKTYFYKPEHFISTSQMIFRMKQNAVGLANITLLAVMAFVSIATTTALYTNTNETTEKLFPKNTSFEFVNDNVNQAKKEFSQYVLQPLHKDKSEFIDSTSTMTGLPLSNKTSIEISKEDIENPKLSALSYTYLITEGEYLSLGNPKLDLQTDQIALYQQKTHKKSQSLKLINKTYSIRKQLKTINFPQITNTFSPSMIIFKDENAVKEFLEIINKHSKFPTKLSYSVYGNLTKNELNQILDKSGNLSKDGHFIAQVQEKDRFQKEIYGLYGGFMFTGFLLGLSFILGAALIIYYKQYSEGKQDKKSYRILQEVGMDQKQVKKTINSQIILVFFMPITMAVLHFSVAMVMLKQMLLMFGVTNTNLIYLISAITILVIILIYFVIYKLTSKTYYNIIER
ncbi:FtsX-like permease family protein [Streptococcus didelphis]|uniref:FtsX-like permease family protein n=1 Tax=Streptococcus didelphis TaxID=102886 RepID=UPI00036473D9|nr:FtsX-like permease family protein [Streptococcus didelphis]